MTSKILVTLSTSHFGTLAINSLLKKVPANNIIGTVRDLSKGAKLKEKGIEIRVGDYTKPETLKEAFKGVKKILFISSIPNEKYPRQNQHKNVVEAAKSCGVEFIVYTSFIHCDENKSALSLDHKFTEKLIKESGIKYTICRNNWYFENDALIWKKCGLEGKKLYNPLGKQKIGYALRREYAEAAAQALIINNPKPIYELAGKPVSFEEVGEALKKVSKKNFQIVNVSKEEFAGKLKEDGYPPEFIGMWSFMINDYANGCLNFGSNDFAEILGRNPTSLESSLEEILKE